MGCTMGLAKCSNIIGTFFFMCFMRHVGVNLLLAKTSSWMVSTLIACLVTILCRAPLGIAGNVVGGGVVCPLSNLLLSLCVSSFHPTFVAPLHSGQMRVVGAMPGTHLIPGTTPGVLFCVTCRCRRVIGHCIGGKVSQLKWRNSLKASRWSKR